MKLLLTFTLIFTALLTAQTFIDAKTQIKNISPAGSAVVGRGLVLENGAVSVGPDLKAARVLHIAYKFGVIPASGMVAKIFSWPEVSPGDVLAVGWPSDLDVRLVPRAWVTAMDEVSITISGPAGVNTPDSAVYNIMVFTAF